MGLSVFVHDDSIEIELSGLDRVASLKSHMRIPLAVVTDARVASQEELKTELGWRVGGTYLPGVIAAGHYNTRDRKGVRQFWDVYRDPEVLLIETRLKNPWRVVLQHPDRERLAWLIAERIPA
jgi:hypothetical protein